MTLAQVDLVSTLNLVVNGGAFALVAWIVIYGAPAFMKKVGDDQKAERDRSSEDQRAERTAFLATLAVERKESTAELAEKRREFLADQKETRDSFALLSRDMMKTYREESLADRLACDKHFETLAASLAKSSEATAKSVEAIMTAVRAIGDQSRSHADANARWATALKEEVGRREEAERQKGGTP
jgi:hypothetical protein